MADQDGRHSEMITQLLRHRGHHLMMRTLKETFLAILSILQVSWSYGGRGGSPWVVEGQKRLGQN